MLSVYFKKWAVCDHGQKPIFVITSVNWAAVENNAQINTNMVEKLVV